MIEKGKNSNYKNIVQKYSLIHVSTVFHVRNERAQQFVEREKTKIEKNILNKVEKIKFL